MVGDVGGGVGRVRRSKGGLGVESGELGEVRGDRWGGNGAAAHSGLRRRIAARGEGRARGRGAERGEGRVFIGGGNDLDEGAIGGEDRGGSRILRDSGERRRGWRGEEEGGGGPGVSG